MHRLVPTLVAEMGGAYPELRRAEPVIVETLRQEEERFRRTLGRGMALLDEATAGLGDGDVLPGETAFKLYDTYGFPLDLTQDAVRAKGITVDTAGFDAAMERQRTMARESWAGSGQQAAGRGLAGPARPARPHRLPRLRGDRGHRRDSWPWSRTAPRSTRAEAGETVEALFDRTPFYAESGGQAGDRGEIDWPGGRAEVLDTQKQAGDLHAHVLEDHRGPARGSAPACAWRSTPSGARAPASTTPPPTWRTRR